MVLYLAYFIELSRANLEDSEIPDVYDLAENVLQGNNMVTIHHSFNFFSILAFYTMHIIGITHTKLVLKMHFRN